MVRVIAAVLLPLAVPAVVTAAMWILPGDPAQIICPAGICSGADELAKTFGIDHGPVGFYTMWMGKALVLEFGNSWRYAPGYSVGQLLYESLPTTALLCGLAFVPITVGSALATMGWLPRRADPIWQVLGLVPAVILALVFAAVVEINFGAISHEGLPAYLRIGFGAIVLGLADGALSGAIIGTRSVFEEEVKQRYIQIAMLRGESVLSNALPNVLPALIGQMRARMLHVLSGAVIVEVVLKIPGLGDLLWDGTLLQDFSVVLAAAFAFSLLSSFLLLLQALSEIAVEMHVRRHPKVQA